MNDSAVADIDADVMDRFIEEDEIARAQIGFGDVPADSRLGGRRAGDRDAVQSEQILCKGRAIERPGVAGSRSEIIGTP
jgi:hypothetical protein